MTKQRYFEMCEMMGTTPIEDEIPIELEDFPDTIQTALAVYSFLRDDWDSVNGEYLGKIFIDVDLAFRAHYVDKEDEPFIIALLRIIDECRSELIKAQKPAS